MNEEKKEKQGKKEKKEKKGSLRKKEIFNKEQELNLNFTLRSDKKKFSLSLLKSKIKKIKTLTKESITFRIYKIILQYKYLLLKKILIFNYYIRKEKITKY